ncbi:uncharacterized protein LOC143233433 isoform X1 [Tachypleus tridentatus]|uniref:uncharacterized protein LOC143233433 isoform X1 n=1 Tax=Tachypleus tridentatus TaxID=6853 RepID=UPI003FD05CB5
MNNQMIMKMQRRVKETGSQMELVPDQELNGLLKCGEDGHMSRDCPNVGGDMRNKSGCFKYGEDGHVSRAIKNPDKQVGRDGKFYVNCFDVTTYFRKSVKKLKVYFLKKSIKENLLRNLLYHQYLIA